MNALTNPAPVVFASAYRQLSAAERAFVDAATREIENAAHRANERISLALNRPIPAHIVQQSGGMLEKPLVCAAITERISQLAAEQELTANRLLKELMGIATANIDNFLQFDENDNPYFDLTRATPEHLAAIKSVEVESNGDGLTRASRTKIKLTFHEKLPAIKMLGEYIGLWTGDSVELKRDLALRNDKTALPATATNEQAADAYAAYLEQ